MNANRSAALAELREMNGQKFLSAADCPVKVTTWRLLIQPMPPKKKSGVIDLPDEVQEAEEYKTCVAKVIDMGVFAYKSKTNAGLNLADDTRQPKIGDFVLYTEYAGQLIELADRQKTKLRIIDDTEVLAVINDPEMIKRYV